MSKNKASIERRNLEEEVRDIGDKVISILMKRGKTGVSYKDFAESIGISELLEKKKTTIVKKERKKYKSIINKKITILYHTIICLRENGAVYISTSKEGYRVYLNPRYYS